MTEEIKSLILSQGWIIVKEILLERRKTAMDSLCSLKDINDIYQTQMRIKEINYFLGLPKELIEKEKKRGENEEYIQDGAVK